MFRRIRKWLEGNGIETKVNDHSPMRVIVRVIGVTGDNTISVIVGPGPGLMECIGVQQ